MGSEAVVVTGAGGFIGGGLVRRLMASDFDVHVLLQGEVPWRLHGVADRVTVHRGDVRDANDVGEVVGRVAPRYVFHLAAHGAYESQADARTIVETNLIGSCNVFAASAAAGVALVVNAGSSSEYGLKREPMRESDRLDPNSFYAAAKAAQTHLATLMARRGPTAVVTLRLFSVYGPWEEPTRLMPTVIRRARAGLPLEMAAPETAHDFVYVDDVLDAMIDVERLRAASGAVLNLGTGVQSTLRDVVAAVQEAVGSRSEVRWGAMPARRWDTDRWQADVSKAREVLGWSAKHTLRQGIVRMAAWMAATDADPGSGASVRSFVFKLVEALFKVLFVYRCEGEEHVPAQGAAVVASNHPSYLDPVLLSLQVARPIRFMAWDALFRVPLLGAFMRAFGAFPVDVRRGKGRDAFEKARVLLETGQVVGLFPEGKRSRTGWMEPALREGAARLALETGAPIVPASITGAFRVWPHYQALPRPGRVRVRFHEPIDSRPYRDLPEEQALSGLLGEIRRRVERSLLPGVKADLRMNVLYRLPSPWPRVYEMLPPLVAATAVFWKTRSLAAVAPAYLYLAYLFVDHLLLPQSRLVKWVRNGSAVFFALGYGPVVLAAVGAPQVPAERALAAACLGGLFAYLYEHTRVSMGAVRGFVLAAALEILAQWRFPDALGPHVALPLFLAVYAWERRSIFWRWSVPVLVAYAAAVPLFLGGIPRPLHALPALLAWLIERVFPYDLAARDSEAPATEGGLGLRL